MLIGIDASRAVGDRRTGTENYSLHLIRALLALGGQHTYRLYTRTAPPHDHFGSSPRAETRAMAWPYLWTHVRLSAELAANPPDVLFVPAHVLPLYRRGPSVVTIHDLGYLRFPAAHRPVARFYLDLGTRFSARVATRVIAVSQATKTDLVTRMGVDPAGITVIPEAPSIAFRPLANRDAGYAVALRYGVEAPYVLALGSVHPRKNLVRLLEAFAKAREGGRVRHRLLLAGNLGYRGGEVREAVHRLGAESWATLAGYVSDVDLPILLGAADALAFPSLYEGFGLPAVEAMASGVPVLSSNTGALPEVLGEAGTYFDPLDVPEMARAIVTLLTNPELKASRAEKGLARGRQFTWERTARETLAVLEAAAD